MLGSGSVGNDACIGSALSAGEKIIVGTNGFFGDRLVAIAESYGLVMGHILLLMLFLHWVVFLFKWMNGILTYVFKLHRKAWGRHLD
jgi:hypothetical protein